MSQLKPYPAYKDSGVGWLGEVPEHWDVRSLKWLVEQVTDKAGTSDFQVGLENIEGWTGRFIETSSEFSGDGIAFQSKDLLFGKLRPYLAKAWLADRCGEAVGDFFVLRPYGVSPVFLHKYILSPLVIDDLDASTIGAKMPRVGWETMSTLPVALPAPPEQPQIVRFLDHEFARIDALIEEQQRLIELLQEKRQAVISHAVTKGLDPTVPMKDSGVEWLGEVPAHWAIVRIGAVYSEAVEKGLAELPVLRVSIHYGVSDKELTEEESDRKITRIEDREKYKRVRPGDLVYNMMRAWQGGFGAVLVDGLVSPAYVVARPKSGDVSRYVERLLRTNCAVEEMRKNSYGITDFRLRLYWDQFKNIRIALPPEEERQNIMERIDTIIGESEALRDEADQLIGILQERRSALISAAVTGKIDVRGWLPPASVSSPVLEEEAV